MRGRGIWELLSENSAAALRRAMDGSRTAAAREVLLSFSDGERFAYSLLCSVGWSGEECWVIGEPELDPERKLQEELFHLTAELARLSRERTKEAASLARALEQLERSHWHIRKIHELLPICAVCGDVRQPDAQWEPLTAYLQANGLPMTHGYCPRCEARALAEIDAIPPGGSPRR